MNKERDDSLGTGLQVSRKRPCFITVFVSFIIVGVIITVCLAFVTDVLREYHPTAPYVSILWCCLGLLLAYGLWQMKKWSYMAYALLILGAYIVYPTIVGKSSFRDVPGLLVQIVLFIILLRYRGKMK